MTTFPFAAGSAHAAPESWSAELPTGVISVTASEYTYIATHSATQQAASIGLPQVIASLPIPQQYQSANVALAAQFDMALQSALATPGGCVQIVIDPRPPSGNLFDYRFFAVAGEYCP
ncbi:hypothetical protein [Gordonia rhizosphera]|nr:hypothetical protein [Gordonia rhizosphera]